MLQLCGIQRKAATLSLVLLLSACGGGDGGTPPSTTTIAKATASGDAQTATVGQALAAPLQVVVTDNGAASAGASVNWTTTSGGSLNPTSSATDANGIAATSWTLGTASGSQQATATLSGATGSPVTFTATASPDQATTLSSAGGDGQSGVINTPLPLQVQAKVADQFGNGIPGVTVDWSATGATVSAPSVPTNASGISAVTVTLGPNEGDVTVTATSGTLSGSPLTFTETATLAPPIPTTASVEVGSGIIFTSNRNGTFNPAIDTVAVGGTVTWSWAGGLHSVQSTGSPSFTNSSVQSSGSYQFTFNTAGTYSYTCSQHPALMTGRIVVRTP